MKIILSEEQVQKLLNWYLNNSNSREWIIERNKIREENKNWLNPQALNKMDENEIKEKMNNYFLNGGGRQRLNNIYRRRVVEDPRLKDTLLCLFNENKHISERIDKVLVGDNHIEGMGKALATSILMDYDIDKYSLWNQKTMLGLSVLGWEIIETKLTPGKIYLNVLDTLDKIKSLKPGYDLTYEDVDLFLHVISAEEEGIEAVSTLIQGEEILDDEYLDIEGMKSMEFAMEKYLEEFIESNFNMINFGANLELFQDEENTGRQYTTSIGRIDLLAIDHSKKEFIVIELKKGRSTDLVVGQILRYMGWVKDHLAENYNVRGIIIAKEKDEKLEYSLKMVSHVEMFLYKVHFDIEKVN